MAGLAKATARPKTKTKTKPTPPDKASLAEGQLESVYADLVRIMKRHAPPFRADIACMNGGKKSFQLTVPKPVAVPGAYGGKPVDLQMAAVILQKDFVGFYLMCIYMNDPEKKKLSPALLKLLKGKTCFHVKKLDDGLRKDIAAALVMGAKNYRERGWV
jgi:hypothetical protein